MNVDTSIIIPAFNESGRLANGYQRLAPVLDDLDLARVEVIVIDDGSSDDTMSRAHEVYGHLPNALFVQHPTNRGKGASIRLGIAVARGEKIITADADMSIDPQHFPAMLAALDASPIVPGSRAEGRLIRYDSALRTYAGVAFNLVVRHYTGTHLRDTQCGCKGFRRGPARLLALLSMVDRFAFDAEILYLARRLDLTANPLHVSWQDMEGSSVHVVHDSLGMLRDIRSLPRTTYVNPVVVLAPDVTVEVVGAAARQARLQGLVLARGTMDSLLVLPRDGSLGGLGVAAVLDGTLRTAELAELVNRSYEAV